MKAPWLLAVLLASGCAAPSGENVQFADALGEPGCTSRHPDGNDEPCRLDAERVTPLAEPPAGWACVSENAGPTFRYALYRSLLTGEHGLAFEDRTFAADASGLVVDSSRPGFIARWDGANAGFVPLGRAMPDRESATHGLQQGALLAQGERTIFRASRRS